MLRFDSSLCDKSNITDYGSMSDCGFEMDLLPAGSDKKSGDCIALRYGNLQKGGDAQTVVIIDGGYQKTAAKLKQHLTEYYNCTDRDGIIHIDLAILSHPDLDHISGLVELMNDDEVQIKSLIAYVPWEIMTPTWFKDGRITKDSLDRKLEDSFSKLKELIESAKAKKVEIFSSVLLGRCVNNGAILSFLGPTEELYKECIANCPNTPEQAESIPQVGTYSSVSLNETGDVYVPGQIDWKYDEGTSPINESSIVFLFEYNGFKVLFTGDAGKEALSSAISIAQANGVSLNDINIIKMPHHGSRKNVTPEIMDNFRGTKSCSCYISCASGDVGHHPSKRMVNMLKEKGFRVLSTSGSTLHRGDNAPKRNWKRAEELPTYDRMEK